MIWLTALSWGAKAVPFLRSPKVMAGIVAVGAAALLWLYVGHLKNEIIDLTAEKQLYMGWYQEAADANATNIETVGILNRANKSLAESVIISEQERIDAVVESKEREALAASALDDTLNSLEELRNETPSCQELSQIDMGAVCPLVTRRLRESAAGTYRSN